MDTLFSKLLSKLSDNTTTSTTRLRTSLEDIIEVFIPFLSRDNLSKLFDFVTPILDVCCYTDQYIHPGFYIWGEAGKFGGEASPCPPLDITLYTIDVIVLSAHSISCVYL